jgi:cell shape-determining protein MreC
LAAGIAFLVFSFTQFRQGAKDAENGIDSFAATVFKTFKGLFDAVKNLTSTFGNL